MQVSNESVGTDKMSKKSNYMSVNKESNAIGRVSAKFSFYN